MYQQNTDPWHVLEVKFQFERIVQKRLNQLGIRAIVPTQKQTIRWSDRYKQQEVVLFSRYVFVCVAPKVRNDVFKAGKEVKGYLYQDGKPAILREIEVELIHELMNLEKGIEITCSFLSTGDKVEILDGPLKGYTGLILEKSGKQRFVLHLPGLKCAAQVEVNAMMLKKTE
jgi:transcription antitermination factor NusG